MNDTGAYRLGVRQLAEWHDTARRIRIQRAIDRRNEEARKRRDDNAKILAWAKQNSSRIREMGEQKKGASK